ncbi:CaiB/BaiF CoA transferase family protein [Achromobacter denitrificans]|uniref:CaiB/BaiF CoA transferase family protein n=1 Tax=Achromobacter denitrificans TaxID=32002 RepID=UPI000F676A8D|nr:CoA transferase [Achromobacter denitrificans]MDF3941466.1 CoA transferase [Achromobacter denitrificans]RSE85500.1 CoA transferase [Achromobacter denitrificans]CAB3865628.1 Succinyl-CoA--L-malate CoA-transferase beta subunit [Achromobacter denitrificans]
MSVEKSMGAQTDPCRGTGPLSGVRVLDISTVVAGPFSCTLMADLGAEVLKVEMPGEGDHIRQLPPHKNGVALWSKVANRNKRGVTLDLRQPDGIELLERLLPQYDVLVENFRPGTLDRWGLDLARLRALRPDLIVLRVTGFGQTGPYRSRPGFARIFEAMSGFVNLCGEQDGPPLYPGFPVSDALTGVFGAYAVAAALLHREKHGEGQEIDLSATEAMLRVLDFMPIEYDQLGVVRTRQGNLNAYSAPSSVYKTRDDKWVVLAVSAPTVFRRLAIAIGRVDLLEDPMYSSNTARIHNREGIEGIMENWFGAHTLAEASDILMRHEVSFSPIYDMADIAADPHFSAREVLVRIQDEELGEVSMQNVVPRFSATPGRIWRAGPGIGQHNDEVYGELGLSAAQQAALRSRNII